MIQQLIEEIKTTASLRGSLTDDNTITQLNRFLYHDLMVDMPIFTLRKSTSFEITSKYSDCYTTSNTKFRTVSSIKSKIINLKKRISSYTNRNVYCHTDRATRMNYGRYTLVSTQREGEFMSNGIISRVLENTVKDYSPLILTGQTISRLSNFWTKVSIYKNDFRIASMLFSKVLHSKTVSENGFHCMINFTDRTFTLQYSGKDKSTFRVVIESFSSNGYMLMADNHIFGAYLLKPSPYMTDEIFIECYVRPYLVDSIESSIDPMLIDLKNIIVLGTASNLCTLYQNSTVQQSVYQQYIALTKKYCAAEQDEDMLEFTDGVIARDPLDMGSFNNYYGNRIGGSYGASGGF